MWSGWDSYAVFCFTFYGSGSEFRTQYEELDRIFGVTKAEQHVLADLLGGHDADHISKMRQISVETVRSHIRAIYRSEEHTSELQSLMRISYAVFCLKKKKDILKY